MQRLTTVNLENQSRALDHSPPHQQGTERKRAHAWEGSIHQRTGTWLGFNGGWPVENWGMTVWSSLLTKMEWSKRGQVQPQMKFLTREFACRNL